MLCSPSYFGLTTISPLQRAICRAADGLPLGDLEDDPDVVDAFGGPDAVALLPSTRPAELVLLAGIRCGKSLLSAAAAVRMALGCDVSTLTAGDIPRVSVLSLSIDTARAIWSHVVGHIEASSALRALLVQAPTADRLLIRHPTGRSIEVKVVAGSRAAGSLVARWSAGALLDEAPRMVGSEDGVVNIDDARQALIGRLLPGAQMFMIGSPWAPFGPVYDLVEEYAGKPSADLVVVRAPAFAMNPRHWTPERCSALRATNLDAYNVDVLCQFMDPVQGLFTLPELQGITRAAPLELAPSSRHSYAAAMDPATRGNGWALVITTNLGKVDGRDRYSVVLCRQWIGSKSEPLSPRAVLAEIADILRPYGIQSVMTDQWSIDPLRDIAGQCGLGLIEITISRGVKFELYDGLKKRVVDRTIELSPDPVLVRDLSSVRKVVTGDGIRIDVPESSDGRHADYASALVLALSRTVRVPEDEQPTEEAAMRAEMARMREDARRAVKARLDARGRGYR